MEGGQCRVTGPIANRIEGNTLGFESSAFRHECLESEALKLMRPSRKRIEGNTLGRKSSALRQ